MQQRSSSLRTACIYIDGAWIHGTAQRSNTIKLHLEVAAADQEVNLTALSLLSSRQHLVDLVEGAVAATFYRDLKQNQ
jgi:hypothetical protein